MFWCNHCAHPKSIPKDLTVGRDGSPYSNVQIERVWTSLGCWGQGQSLRLVWGCLLTATITEAFGLLKQSFFSKYKMMLFLSHLRVNWIQIWVPGYFSSRWLVVNNHAIPLRNILAGTYGKRTGLRLAYGKGIKQGVVVPVQWGPRHHG